MPAASSLGYLDGMSARGSLISSTIALAMLLVCGSAGADTKPVVVIGGGSPFRDAISVALTPWSLRVVPLEGAPPRPQMPGAADEARAIAQREGASGVVWIALERNEPSLWVFDAATDQLVTRRIAIAPPFDAPTAASAALTVKTLLRASTVAPAEERLGAPPPLPPPIASEASVAPTAHENGAPAAAPTPAPTLRAEVLGAARAIASDADMRGGIALSLWLGEQRTFGLGLGGTFGPGLSIDADRFRGRFSEVAVSPSGRLRFPIGRRFAIEPRVGMTLHVTTIDGAAVLTARPASTARADASVDAAVAFDVIATSTLAVGIETGMSAMLRYQRYLVESASVFDLHPVQGYVGLRLTTSLL